jgi:hypothetical protein
MHERQDFEQTTFPLWVSSSPSIYITRTAALERLPAGRLNMLLSAYGLLRSDPGYVMNLGVLIGVAPLSSGVIT